MLKKFLLVVFALSGFLSRMEAAASAEQSARFLAGLLDAASSSASPSPQLKATLCKTLYSLRTSAQRGAVPERLIDQANELNGLDAARAALLKNQLLIAYRRATDFGLFANPDSLELLRNGVLPRIRSGLNAGEAAEVDYVVPIGRFPQWKNDLANLELVPASTKRKRQNNLGTRELAHLASLAGAETPSTRTFVLRPRPFRSYGARITAPLGQYVDLRRWGGHRYAFRVLPDEANYIPVYLSGPPEANMVPSVLPTLVAKSAPTRLPGIPLPAHLIYDNSEGLRVYLTEEFPRRIGECSLVIQRQL